MAERKEKHVMPGQSDVVAENGGEHDTETTVHTPEPTGDPEGTHSASTPDEPTDGESPHREAAKYRTRLREVESERDGLSAQLDAMRRAEVVRLAGERLARGDDLLTHRGDDLTPYLADDGTVSAERVSEAVTALVEERGYYLTGKLFQGTGDGGVRGTGKPTPEPRMGDIFSGDAA